MFGGFSYDIQINTTNPEDMDNLDILLNFDWMNHVANQMETEMAFQMERKYPKEQDRKVFRLSEIFDGLFYQVVNSPKFSIDLLSSVRRVAPYSHWVGVLYGLTDGELNSE